MVAVKSESAQGAVGRFLTADKWTGRYQRNNKRSGLKNLRCFPYCSDSHRLRGFCGREVALATSNAGREKLYSWAEFHKAEDEKKGASGLEVGEVVSAQEVRNRVRTKKQPFRPWYAGEPLYGENSRVAESVVFEYNKSRKGWNYGWVANKHTCDSVHTLRAYVCAQLPDGSFQCRAIFDSPGFTLFCRRRQRQNVVDLPEHLKTQMETVEAARKRKAGLGEAGCEARAECGVMASKRRCSGLEDAFFASSFSSGSFEGETSSLAETSSLSCISKDEEKRNELIWRIIHALLRLEMDDGRGPNREKKEEEPRMGEIPSGSAQKEDTVLDELLEAYFSPGSNDPLDLDAIPVGNDLEPLCVDMTDLDTGEWFDKARVIEELAQFMVEESSFTRAIEEVLGGKAVKGLSFEQKKRKLFDSFAQQLESFLDKFAMSLEALDLLLAPCSPPAPAAERMCSQISLYSSVQPCRPVHHNSEPLSKLSGRWRRTKETLDNMESIWLMLGLPWLIRRALHRIEHVFEIHLAQHMLEYRTPKKLMFNGVVQFKLDGRVHPFMVSPPLPMPGYSLFGSKDMSFNPTCCAYVEGKRIILIQTLEVDKRVWRSVDVSPDGNTLHSTISVQVKEDVNGWVTEGVWQGVADRVG